MEHLAVPRIELLPLKANLPAGQDTELTLLARIHPASAPVQAGPRPPLNVSFVIDRSGSMSGHPLAMARQAVQVGLKQLEPHDRASVVTFDDRVEVLIPSQHVTDAAQLCREVEQVTAGGSTALHGGWLDGAMQVAQFLNPAALNRVILLSDGHANSGKTRLQDIQPDVAGLTARGVSTSALGLGEHYDEDLLRGMAVAGDGNFEHIEDPAQLPAYFDRELRGLSRTTAHTVSLGIEPNPQLGSARQEIVNILERNPLGRAQLPNLVDGQPLEVVISLHVPAQHAQGSLGVTRVRLAWTGRDGVRRTQRAQLNLPVVDAATHAAAPEHLEVRAALELQRNARAKRDAVALIDAGDVLGSQRILRQRSGAFSEHAHAVPAGTRELELQELTDLADQVMHNAALSRKRAVAQEFDRSRSRR